MKLNVGAFALTAGLVWGVSILIVTWWFMIAGTESPATTMLNQIYFGYSVSAVGSVIGLVWGFVCGTVCGGIFAWLYNYLSTRIGAGG